MENLKLQYECLLKAYTRLLHMIKKLEEARLNSQFDEDDILAYRDSVIKRFEFCFDLNWKFLKTYLEKNCSMVASSPKKIFRMCFQQELITEQEAQQLLNMTDDRNFTAHAYNEDIAQQISQRITQYYKIMREIGGRLSKHIEE